MRRNLRSRAWGAIAVLAAAVCLLVAAVALAATPIAGKTYTGLTSGRAVNGWKPSVRFKVSSNGKQLLGFDWHGACVRHGPPPPNMPPGWIDPSFVHPVGTLNVDSSGAFAVKNAKQTENYGPHGGELNTSTVTGVFKTAKTATGTIKYTQKDYTVKGRVLGTCSRTVSFTAKAD
jgi:hypothetical protein